MEQWQVDLIDAVTRSALFDTSTRELRRRVLLHLAQHSRPEDRELRSARALADLFPSNSSGNVSLFITQLKDKLDEYFDSEEGERHTYRIHIIHGNDADARRNRYVLEFPVNKNALLRAFWEPYLEGKAATLIAYGVPLFMRDPEQTVFTRYVDINEPKDVGKVERPGDESCWPFVTHGDLEAVIELLLWLRARNRAVDYKHFRAETPLADILTPTSRHSNVIVVGSTRVNGLLREYQERELKFFENQKEKYLPFRLRLHDVVELDEHGREVRTFREERGETTKVPVVVTRRFGVIRNTVTLIGANHGRAVHRVAEDLTDEESLAEWFDDPLLRPWRTQLPKQFQIVLSVPVFDGEQMGGTVAVEAVWPLETDRCGAREALITSSSTTMNSADT